MRVIYLLILVAAPLIARADLVIDLVDESALSYELSPRNYNNSPRNYGNSIRNYDNSPRNYANSPRNYDNSPRNYENGKYGERRLLVKKNGGYYFAGYYAWSDGGIINFFSAKGERLFYSPPKTGAIFDGESGDFCGTIATLEGNNVLALTETGQLALLKAGVSLSNSVQNKPSTSNNQYAGSSGGHWIQENIDSGTMIILEDGSIWQIDPMEKIETMLWLPISNITVVPSDNGSPGYDYLLINTDDGEKAHAKYIGNK